MIINGRQIASDVEEQLRSTYQNKGPKKLAVIVVGEDPASISYTNQKKLVGERLGVNVEIYKLDVDSTEDDVVARVENLNADEKTDGIIVQLPLPKAIGTEVVLRKIAPDKDVDSLSDSSDYEAPVVRAVREVLRVGHVGLHNKNTVVIGQGRLVGKPISDWFETTPANLSIADINTTDLAVLTKPADIIISGAGVPNLLTPYMVKEGVVLIDAGTSEDSGRIVGDMSPECAEKASLFCPVPGGVGPIVVVMLFKNILQGSKK